MRFCWQPNEPNSVGHVLVVGCFSSQSGNENGFTNFMVRLLHLLPNLAVVEVVESGKQQRLFYILFEETDAVWGYRILGSSVK